MITLKEIIQKWQKRIDESKSNGQMLFALQANQNYTIIKRNTPQKALEELKEQHKKYGEMGIGIFIKEAMNDLEELIKNE